MDIKTGRRYDLELFNKNVSSDTLTDSLDRKRSSSKLPNSADEISYKRPKLTVDTSTQPLCEALSSNESFNSPIGDMEAPPTGASSLSAYLEDIVSDEEPLDEATPPHNQSKTPPPTSPVSKWSVDIKSKEELLLMMETVDCDIASIEQQISLLEKQQQEEMSLNQSTTPSSNLTPPISSVNSTTGSSSDHFIIQPPYQSTVISSDQSLIDIIYHDNKLKVANNHILGGVTPQYYQPSEVTTYFKLKERHKIFRPKLLEYMKRKKLQKHQKELKLCKEYDKYSIEWERRLNKWMENIRKKNRDSKNKELFEKVFPELRTKRDQLRHEAYSRVGVRSFGVVRSEAELNQLACELFEQDEARDRYHKISAVIPPMYIDESDRNVQYINANGLINDPMSVHRECRTSNIWSEEEKSTFKNKYILFPKNFEKIASFLPNKSINECIRYYYLVKKKEHFKQLTRRSSFKRKRIHKQQHEFHPGLTSPLILDHTKSKPRLSSSDGGHSSAPPSVITSPTPPTKSPIRLSEYNGWTEKEITSLKEGLRRYGRAWGKVYREVGGGKSATQCKQFYDMYCTDTHLMLNNSLAEHSSQKNAEKVKKKMIEMKKPHLQNQQAPPITTNKRKNSKQQNSQQRHQLPVVQSQQETVASSNDKSDNEAISSDSDIEESEELSDGSETTLTDSEPDDTKLNDIQSPLDIFLSAAEALSNTIPVEIALHDHTYSRPPMDIQGNSGLQLIAAAAAVVSPNLTTKVSSHKSPLTLSTNKAPRGRPPSQQKRNYCSQKLAPSFLTPTSGASQNVLLQDFKPTMRGRSRSAPTEKLRPPIPSQKPLLSTSVLSVKSNHTPSTKVTSHSNMGGVNTVQYIRNSSSTSTSTSTSTRSINSNGINNSSDTKLIGLSSAVDTRYTSTSTSTTSTSVNKAQQRKDGTILELNLGNMALLLAATGNNQQAALLLPQSSILNKQTLAVLQGMSDTTATINIDPSVLVTNGNKSSCTTKDTIMSTVKFTKKKDVHANSSDVPTHTTGSTSNASSDHDLTNLNLLSNLVAGLPKKSDSTESSTNSTSTNTSTTVPLSKPVSLSFKKQEDKQDTIRKPDVPFPAHNTTQTQQSLMLYTRSLSMPLQSAGNLPDEDHLEYATREISELSKLLCGTGDNGLETPPTETPPTRNSQWSPDDLLCNPFNDQTPPTTIHHTITSSLTATDADLLAPPTHQMLPNRTTPPINAHSESNS